MIRIRRNQDKSAIYLQIKTGTTTRSFGINADNDVMTVGSEWGRFLHFGPFFYFRYKNDSVSFEKIAEMFGVDPEDLK